jgi:hypothetical protein
MPDNREKLEEEFPVCVYCGVPVSGGEGGWYVEGGGETCPSGKSPTTFHEVSTDRQFWGTGWNQ